MIPDHIYPNGDAPETYDRDWFLSQLNGRDPTAARDVVAPASSGADPVADAPGTDADADGVPPELGAEAEVIPAPAEAEVIPEPVVDDDDEVFPAPGAGSRARRAGVLVGAVAGLVLVASVAFAASTIHPPEQPAGAQDRPSETSLPTRAGGTPIPQLTTLPFPGDAPRNSGAPANDDGKSPTSNNHSSSSAGEPPDSPTPTSTGSGEPTSDPTSTEPSDPTSTDPDPDPAPDPDPDPDPDPSPSDDCGLLCEIIP